MEQERASISASKNEELRDAKEDRDIVREKNNGET
jgi:hypothetical protein